MGLRQTLLDHLVAHPSSTPRDVWQAIAQRVELATVSRCLTEMARNGACTRTQDMKERGAPYRYKAVVTQASDSNPRGAPKQETKDEPGRYIHANPNRKAIKNQGGQGGLLGFLQTCMISGE